MDHDGISKKRATLIVPNQSTVKLGDEWIDRENDWRSIVSCPWFVIQNFFAVCAMVDLERRIEGGGSCTHLIFSNGMEDGFYRGGMNFSLLILLLLC